MPKAFDLQPYTANFNPLTGGTFISIQDVMAAGNPWGEVLNLMLEYLPQLIAEIPQIVLECVDILLEEIKALTGIDLTSLLTLFGPLAEALTGAAGGLPEIAAWALSIDVRTISALITLLTTGDPTDLVNALVTGFNTVTGVNLGSNDALFAPIVLALTGTAGGLSALTTWAAGLAVVGATGQQVLDAIVNLVTGSSTTGHTLTGLTTALSSIPQSMLNITSIAASLITGTLTTGNIPALPISQITSLAGYLTNLSSSGVLALAGLASGALPTGITLPGAQLTGSVAASLISGALALGNIPALPVSQTTGLAGYLTNLSSGGTYGAALPISQITSLAGYLTNLSSSGVLALAGLASGSLPVGVTLPGGQLTGSVAAALISGVLGAAQIPSLGTGWTGTVDGSKLAGTVAAALISGTLATGNIPALPISQITSLAGYLTNLSSSGVLALAGLASGSLPVGVTLPGGQLTGTVAAALISGVLTTGNIPALPITQITGLGGYLTNLSSSGVLALAGLASGALPSGITLPGGQLTGSVAASIVSGALSSATLAATALTSGAIPSGVTLPGGQLTGAGSIAASLLASLDASKITTGVFGTAQIPSITAAMAPALAPIDTLMNAWGIGGSGYTAGNLGTVAAAVPYAAIQGSLGPANIGGSIGGVVDNLYQGLATAPSASGVSLSQLGNVANQLTSFIGYIPGAVNPPAASVAGQAQINTANIAQRAVTKPVYVGVDQSADAVFPWSSLAGATLPTIAVTAGNSAIGIIGTPDAGVKESVEWYGSYTGTLEGLYINLCQINVSNYVGVQQIIKINGSPTSFTLTFNGQTTAAITYATATAATVQLALSTLSTIPNGCVGVSGGAGLFTVNFVNQLGATNQPSMSGATSGGTGSISITNASQGQVTRLWSSANMMIKPGVGSGYGWNFANIPTAQYVTSIQGGYYAVEMMVTGSGTYNIAGVTHQAIPHPTAIPPSLGGTRVNPVQLFSSTAAGASATQTTTANHLFNLGDTAIVIAVNAYGSTHVASTMTCTVGGVSATQLYFGPTAAGSNETVGLFGLTNAAGFTPGNQSVQVKTTGMTGTLGIQWVSGSYQNVSGFGTVQNTGFQTAGPTTTQTVTGITAPTLVVQAFSGYSGYSGTQWTVGTREVVNIGAIGVTNYDAVILQDAYVSGNVTFQATDVGTSVGTGSWVGMAVPLIGTAAMSPVVPDFSSYISAYGPEFLGAPGNNVATISHVCNSGDNCIIVSASIYSATAITSVAATFGGNAATLLKLSPNVGSSNFNYIATFGLVSSSFSSGGARSLVMTVTGGSAWGITMESVSYKNITSLGTAQTASGSTASAQLTTTGITVNTLVYSAATSVGAGYFISAGPNVAEVATNFTGDTVNNYGGYYLVTGDSYWGANKQIKYGISASSPWYLTVVPITVGAGFTAVQQPAQIWPTYSGNMPWFGLCAAAGVSQFNAGAEGTGTGGTGGGGAPVYLPVLQEFAASGTYDLTKFTWANWFDVVVLGDGGGGGGGLIVGNQGHGGYPGSWNKVTLTWAQITNNGANTSLTVTVGTGGSPGPGGSFANNGNPGSGASVTIPGYGTVSGAGGAGGAANAGSPVGVGPGNYTAYDVYGDADTYPGGGNQNTPGQNGLPYGGGGAGGQNGFLAGGGGSGARGYAAILAYQ